MRPHDADVWVETPSNPLWKVTDIARWPRSPTPPAPVRLRQHHGHPRAAAPFALGADLTMYATTKFLGGHSDVLGGALVTREADDFCGPEARIQGAGGAVPRFDCWLVLRGLADAALARARPLENALKVARSWNLTRRSRPCTTRGWQATRATPSPESK